MARRIRLNARPTGTSLPPPDAGASYLGTYGLGNAWTAWLLAHEPNLLASPPSALTRTDVGAPPLCDAVRERVIDNEWRKSPEPDDLCEQPMLYRPGAWCCYRHEVTVRLPIAAKFEEATILDGNDQPIRDVTKLLSDVVDVMFYGRPGERPRWRAVKVAS